MLATLLFLFGGGAGYGATGTFELASWH